MYSHILISTDGSETAQKGLDHGLSLAKKLGAKVTIVTATEPYPYQAAATGAGWMPTASDLQDYEKVQAEQAEQVLSKAAEAAAKAGVKATGRHVPDTWPSEAIVAVAKAEDCNLIVMASHGRRGLKRLLLGSQTSDVLVNSGVPVLVVR